MELRPSKYVLMWNMGKTTPLWELPAREPINYILVWVRRPPAEVPKQVTAKALREVTLKQLLVRAPDGKLEVRPVFVVGQLDPDDLAPPRPV